MAYLQIVLAIIAFASSHKAEFKAIWEAVVKLYLDTRDALDKIKAELPGVDPTDGVLQFTSPPTAEELDAEERLEALIAPNALLAIKLGGSNLRGIISWLMTTDLGKSLLKEILGRIGS